MTAVDFAIAALASLGLIGSWAADVIVAETSAIALDWDKSLVMVAEKTSAYYAAHGVGLACVMLAGLLAALRGRFRTAGAGVAVAFYILAATAIVWAVASYPVQDLCSSKVLSATGPFAWLTLLLLLAGVSRATWTYLDPVIRLLAYLSAALSLRALTTMDYGYYHGFSKYLQYTIFLMWLGGWTLLTATRMRGWRLLVRSIPAMVMVVMALFTQSRSWTILSLLLFATFALLRARERGAFAAAVRSLVLGVVVCLSVGALAYEAMPGKLGVAVSGLAARLGQDTRSDQYTQFFNSVPVTDLLFGRGPLGTWYWEDVGDYQYFDNGYLWILFEGGVPTLVCFIAIVLWPAFRVWRRKPTGDVAAAASMVLIWGLALTGLSTFTLPTLSVASYMIALLAGRCWLVLAETAEQRVRPAAGAASPGGPSWRTAGPLGAGRRAIEDA